MSAVGQLEDLRAPSIPFEYTLDKPVKNPAYINRLGTMEGSNQLSFTY